MINECLFVIPAGGCGQRFGASIPKQFVDVDGAPIIIHTLHAIAPYATKIIVALSPSSFAFWEDLKLRFEIAGKCLIVPAGTTRFHSVKQALEAAPSTCRWVAVHDAVRPLIHGETIEALLQAAQLYGAAIPYQPLTDSLRKCYEDGPVIEQSEAVNRCEYVTVQTPQIFNLEDLQLAYKMDYRSSFTDDCSVYEYYWKSSPALVLNNHPNIKITHPQDADWFQLLRNKAR